MTQMRGVVENPPLPASWSASSIGDK